MAYQEFDGELDEAPGYTEFSGTLDAPKPRTKSEAAMDGASSFGASVNNTLKTLTDLAGTNNPVSQFLGENAKTWQGNYSPQYQAELQKQAEEKAALGADPSYADRAGLMAKQVIRNPIEGVGELAGNIAPMMIGGAAGLGLKGMTALSAAMGAGAVKGGIAETVQNAKDADLMPDPLYAEMRKSGLSEDAAKAALSEQRASYGDAYGKILLGAGIGAAVGRFGSVENAIANMGKGAAGQGFLKSIGKEVVTEIPQEMTETYLGNTGAASRGAKIAPDQGVIEAGVKAGILSAVGGGVAGLSGRTVAQPSAPIVENAEPAQVAPPAVPQNATIEETAAAITSPTITDVDDAIAVSKAATSAPISGLTESTPTDEQELTQLVQSEQRNLQVMRAQMEQDRIKQAQLDQIPAIAAEQDATQSAVQRAAELDAPTVMSSAFAKLFDETIRAETELKEPVPAPTPKPVPEPRIVERTEGMIPVPRELADLRVAMNGGEVVRVQNRNGKFAYLVLPDESQPSLAKLANAPIPRTEIPNGPTITPAGLDQPATPSPSDQPAGSGADSMAQRDDAGRGLSDTGVPVGSNGQADTVPLPGGVADSVAAEASVSNGTLAPIATTFPHTINPSGTVLVDGDPAAIRAAFPGVAGAVKFSDGKPVGVLFGVKSAPAVLDFLRTNQPAAPVTQQSTLNTPDSESVVAQTPPANPYDPTSSLGRMWDVVASGESDDWRKTNEQFLKDEGLFNPRRPLNGFQSGHRELISIAIHQGKPVPLEVMAEYPDLKRLVAQGITGAQSDQAQQVQSPKAPSQAESVAQESEPVQQVESIQLGRNNVPLAEGGKPYKTKMGADIARKNQPMMRTKRVEGGYALVEKTPAQLAAQEKAAKRLSQPRTSPMGEPIPAHAMIASAGGLSKQVQSDLGIGDNPKVGNRRLFAGAGGLTIEQATEKLVEDGYLQEGATHNQAFDLIKRSLTNPQYTPEGTERMAEKELQEREAAFHAEQEAVARVESHHDNEAVNIDDADIPWDAQPSNVSDEDAMRILGFSEKEIEEYVTTQRREIEGRTNTNGEGTDEGSTAQASPNMGSREGATSQDQGSGEGLTAPTRADVLAKQDRVENAQALDDKAQIDKEAGRQTLTQQSAPEQRKDTSGDMFGEEKASLESAKREADAAAKNEASKDPNQAGMFDEPTPQSKTASTVEKLKNAPILHADSIIDESDTQADVLAKGRDFYSGLERDGVDSPAFDEWVSFDEKGWKYITDERFAQSQQHGEKKKRSEQEVRLRISLLPKAKEVIANADSIEETRDEGGGVKRYSLLGRFDDGDAVRVIIEERNADGKKFLSVFDLERVAKQLNRSTLPATVQESKPSVQGKATGDDSVTSASVAQPAPESKPADKATETLDAANVTGAERVTAMIAVNRGDLTPEQLAAAYPAAAEKLDAANKPAQEQKDGDSSPATANTKDADGGNVAMFSRSNSVATGPGYAGDVVVRAINDRISGSGNSITLVKTFTDLPQEVQDVSGDPDGLKGIAFGRGKVYIVQDQIQSRKELEEVIVHELYGHAGLRSLFGPDIYRRLNKLYLSLGETKIAELVKKYKLDVNGYVDHANGLTVSNKMTARAGGTQEIRNAWLTEEALAHIAEKETGTIKQIALEVVGAIRAWFRDNGFMELSKLGMSDIAHILKQARQAAFTGTGIVDVPMFSRSGIVGQTTRQHTPEQLRAMKNVGFQVETPTLKERAQALYKDAGKKLAQGIVDQFAPVKDLDKNAYGLLRLAKGASGAFEAFLHGGKLKLTDGVYDFDDANKGGVIDKLLMPLQGEHHDFMRWVAANRAERLQGEGKERLFSAQDIADLKTLASGTADFDYTMQTGPGAGRVTRDRTLIYADANRVFNEFNKNILDMAEQSGLIDGASRKVWEHEFYVPFYRVADEDGGGVRGMSVKGSVLRQQAFKELKGGKNALNADLLDNTLMNWAHLLDASAKNRAAKATIEAAEAMGIATGGNQPTLASMGASIHNKHGVVWFMDGGQKRYSLIDNQGDGPFLMTAINALEYAGMRNPVMNAMGAMKHALTVGVTASPFFKVRNLIRDSVQAIGTGNLSYNPATNIAQGWKLTDPKSDAYFRILAGGGTIHFGTMMEGSEAKRVQDLVASGVDESTILTDPNAVKAFYKRWIRPGVDAYNELGNRGEAINRAALYDQLRKQGMNHADASLQARDLMDFSMQGSFTTIRFLTQVVPFLNARLQGLYKLGRAANENPQRFGVVLGAAAVMSIVLLAAYGDDDDWKKREEWDRNNFWWFKFGGTAFRIPKPFEIGAIATLAERGFELAFDKEMTNKRFMNQVMTLLGDNLSMNPVPQLVKPMLDVYANKDSFSGRPIETMSMERLKSEYRFTDHTSMAARAASTGLNAVTGLVGKESLSPVQIDSMLRGYFGWLGTFAVGAADVLARPLTGQPEQAAPDYWKVATGGMLSDLRDAPSRYVSQMYEQAREVEQAYGTWRMLQNTGKLQEAAEFRADNADKLNKYRHIETVKRSEARLNERIRMIERSNMDGDAKRDLIRSIQAQKDRVAHLVAA